MEILSQKQTFAEVLKRINEDVTKEDREEALKHCGIKSNATLSNYLNGKGSNNQTAATLIQFFKSRISERNRVLG